MHSASEFLLSGKNKAQEAIIKPKSDLVGGGGRVKSSFRDHSNFLIFHIHFFPNLQLKRISSGDDLEELLMISTMLKYYTSI